MSSHYSYRTYVWKRFRKNKPALISAYLLGLLVLVAVFSDFIANQQPLYAKYRGKVFYPAFQTLFHKTLTDSTLNPLTGKYERLQFDITDWRQLDLEKVVWAPIPYSATQHDKYNTDYAAPSANQKYKNSRGEITSVPPIFKHKLGTNNIGQDVAAGLIHGTGVAMRVGLIAMGIAAFFGILIGALAGYFGDHALRIRRASYLLGFVGLFFGYFYGFVVRKQALAYAFNNGFGYGMLSLFLGLIIAAVFIVGFGYLGTFFRKSKKVHIPVDILISKLIEIVDSMPALLLIITISALFIDKSLVLVMTIIGLLSAPRIARLVRAEFLRIRNLGYIQSARALGLGDTRIILRHILPNTLAPVFVYIAFGIASAVIAESSLSFLGIGVPPEDVTWGSLISSARDNYSAWWMVVFPGLAIFATVTMYNLIGEGLRDALDPKRN